MFSYAQDIFNFQLFIHTIDLKNTFLLAKDELLVNQNLNFLPPPPLEIGFEILVGWLWA
jgi:hypothetical protein